MDNTTVEKNTNAATTKTDKPRRDLYREVTDKIISRRGEGIKSNREEI